MDREQKRKSRNRGGAKTEEGPKQRRSQKEEEPKQRRSLGWTEAPCPELLMGGKSSPICIRLENYLKTDFGLAGSQLIRWGSIVRLAAAWGPGAGVRELGAGVRVLRTGW